jgi:hypothetical protein
MKHQFGPVYFHTAPGEWHEHQELYAIDRSVGADVCILFGSK